MNKSRLVKLAVVGGILGVLAIGGFGLYAYARDIRNQALQREAGLVATYKLNQTELTSYSTTFMEQVGIAGAKSDRISQVIQDAVTGRYGDQGFKGGQVAAAIVEAYPDVKSLDIYDKILPTIAAGREGFRNKQNLLIDQAREYDVWRKQGLLQSWILSGVFPSRDLKITAGSKTYYAQEALDKLSSPILTAGVAQTFESGVQEPLAVPAKSK